LTLISDKKDIKINPRRDRPVKAENYFIYYSRVHKSTEFEAISDREREKSRIKIPLGISSARKWNF